MKKKIPAKVQKRTHIHCQTSKHCSCCGSSEWSCASKRTSPFVKCYGKQTPTSLNSQNIKHGGSESKVSTSFIKPQLATGGWASLSKGQLTRSPLWAPQSSAGETISRDPSLGNNGTRTGNTSSASYSVRLYFQPTIRQPVYDCLVKCYISTITFFFFFLLHRFLKNLFCSWMFGQSLQKHLNYQNPVQRSARASPWSQAAAGAEVCPPLLLVFT